MSQSHKYNVLCLWGGAEYSKDFHNKLKYIYEAKQNTALVTDVNYTGLCESDLLSMG